jgi:hypothetical protein
MLTKIISKIQVEMCYQTLKKSTHSNFQTFPTIFSHDIISRNVYHVYIFKKSLKSLELIKI